MSRVLVLATTTGYQTRTFGEAAERLGVELVFGTDRCHLIDDPWRDGAIPIRFFDEDASVEAILEASRERPIHGVLAVGDRPTVIAARVAAALGLPWHSIEGAVVARNKLRTRVRLRDAGLPMPWFTPFAIDVEPTGLSREPWSYPCIVKPVSLSGSRGVMRADNPASLAIAIERLRGLMRSPEIRAERDDTHATALLEGFIPGHEYAIDALLDHGDLHVLAIFDKPDPLDGPFFEETIYVTPPAIDEAGSASIVKAVTRAADAIGLTHGPIHAECRVNPSGVFVLEVAARPIGGLCAGALRFEKGVRPLLSLEEVLLRHALGEAPNFFVREACASGVMMIPIPRRGVYRGVRGVDDASRVEHIDEVRITAKTDQLLVPLPEGASYLGFIFARADHSDDVDRALRAAHARLSFVIDPEFPIRALNEMRYNSPHG